MGLVKILVVENDVFIGEDLQEELENLGYAVAGPVATGEEALEVFEEQRPDLVLMDISLDGEMDDIEAAKRMREQWPVPIIYVTDHHDSVTVNRVKPTKPEA